MNVASTLAAAAAAHAHFWVHFPCCKSQRQRPRLIGSRSNSKSATDESFPGSTKAYKWPIIQLNGKPAAGVRRCTIDPPGRPLSGAPYRRTDTRPVSPLTGLGFSPMCQIYSHLQAPNSNHDVVCPDFQPPDFIQGQHSSAVTVIFIKSACAAQFPHDWNGPRHA